METETRLLLQLWLARDTRVVCRAALLGETTALAALSCGPSIAAAAARRLAEERAAVVIRRLCNRRILV